MGRKVNLEQRTNILKTSYKLFLEYGCDNVTTRMIAEQCGLKRALLHHYFNKKEEIILGVYLDISKEAIAYFKRTLSEEQLSNMDVGLFLLLYYEMMQITPNYADINLTIYRDARLLNKLVEFAQEHHDFYGSAPYSEKKKLGMFMFAGSLSQLILLYFDKKLSMPLREVVNFALRSYYFYLGKSFDESQQLIDSINNIITEQYVKDFITHYNEIMF